MTSIYGDAIKRADAENTGQRVYYAIRGLKQKPNETRKRWVWELLQNAHDARQVKDQRGITVEIKYSQEELIFLHNGTGFNADEIAHLIRFGQKDITRETVRQNMYFIQNIGDSIAPLWNGLKALKKKPVDIDIILDVEERKAGIVVKKSVWESDGFPLENLAENLK